MRAQLRTVVVLSCLALSACGEDDASGDIDAADTTADATAPDTADTTAPDAADTTAPDTADTTAPDTADTTAPDTADTTAPDVVVPEPPDCGDGLLVTREGAAGDVAFRLDRCMPQICGGGCPVSSPQLVITHPGGVDVATTDLIVYTKTHHNWTDSLVGTLADRKLLWRVEFDSDDGLVELHTIAIEALDGTPLLAPVTITIDPFGGP